MLFVWFASQSPTILQFQLSSWQFSHIQTFTLVKEASIIKNELSSDDGDRVPLYHPTVNQFLIECIHNFCLFETSFLCRHLYKVRTLFFPSLVYVEGKFFSFSFTTRQEKNVRCWFFPHFPSSFLKIVLIWLLLPRQQSRKERCVFFLRQLTPTVSTVFSHRKVACYLHKQEF